MDEACYSCGKLNCTKQHSGFDCIMEFLGMTTFEGSAGKFEFGMSVANRYGDQVPCHGHNSAHFMWAIVGSYETRVSRRGDDTSGIVVFNPAGTEHRDRFLSPGAFFSLKIFDDESIPVIPSSVSLENSAIRSLFWRICNESVYREDDSSMIVEGLCYEALSMIGRQDSNAKKPPGWLNIACEYLREGTNSTIADAARQVDVHPTHFVRAFKNCMKCTPGDYRRLAKIQLAASKMAQSRLTIAEIAADTGYTDQSHFTRHFRRAFGITPGAFRSITNP